MIEQMATESEIDAALRELKLRLESDLGDTLVRLLLFGSRARGDHEPGSDIDVAVVVTGLRSAHKNKILDEIADMEVEFLVPISAHVMSADDFNRLLSRERRFALDIEREGVPL